MRANTASRRIAAPSLARRHDLLKMRDICPQKIQSDRINESNTPIHGGVCVGAKGLEPLTFSV